MGKQRYIDITGQKFNRLLAIEYRGNSKWLFQCDCGKQVIVAAANVKRATTKSCGCLQKEISAKQVVKFNTRHGKHGTPEYRAWNGMKNRCRGKNNPKYKDYGGRGIKVCDRWQGEHGFENFLADMGERPSPKHSIDRIDVNGNYCPENCRWATPREQANNMRTNIPITHNGRTQTLSQWCDELNISRSSVRARYSKGERDFDKLFNPNNTWFKKVAHYNTEGNLICVYATQTDAAKALNISRSYVRSCCLHRVPTPRYILEYSDVC